jgi:hypothetical protein
MVTLSRPLPQGLLAVEWTAHKRFTASDPSKAEKFSTGWSGSGLGIDSQGNVWVTNRLGNSMRGELVVGDMIVTLKTGGNADEVLTRAMLKQRGGEGSITLLRPDGTDPGSPFKGGDLPGPYDHRWQRQCLDFKLCGRE